MRGNHGNRNQGRGNFRGRGGGRGQHRGRGGGGGNNFRRDNQFRGGNNTAWQTTERLSEPEVGITQYISSVEGFTGIIKSRFSDFHVNEIDLEGNEAVLSDFTIPEPPEEPAEPNTDPETELKEFITEEQLKSIHELVDTNPNALENVRVDVTDYDKEKRAKLHVALKLVFAKKIFNETVAEGESKFILVKKSTKNDQQRALGWRWPHDYTCFVMFKENIDTLQAIAALSHQLGMKPALFAYAGTKDKRAKTSQLICVKKIEPSMICKKVKYCKGVRVGNFKFIEETLRLGDLKGNRFRIALRSVKGEKENIEKSLESLREIGFINYYGLQRFGNCQKIPTYMIGQALLSSDFKEACELIMKERDGEPNFMQKMRKVYADTKDAKEALKQIHSTNTSVEARLLHGLAKNGDTNYLQALLKLPRNMLMLYTHSYQSFIFNQIASKRRDLGLEVIEGDLVYTDKPGTEIVDTFDEAAASNDVSTEESDVPEEEEEKESKFLSMVRPLTKEDIDSKKFTVYDIVLPLPGYDIKYPDNAIGSIYTELMEKDNLSSEKLRSKHNVFSLAGAYRRVFVKPEKFSWKFMNYEHQNDDLILSDYSRLCKDPEIEDKPGADNLALILDFELPSSCYATMALREVMKCDTSVGNQIILETEIKKEANEKADLKRMLESASEVDAKIPKLESDLEIPKLEADVKVPKVEA